MKQQAIVLFGHGARDPEWARPLWAVQSRIREHVPEQVVELAFLEFLSPTLGDCVATLAAKGMRQVQVVPMFIAQSGHLKRDLPALLDQLRQQFPQVHIVLAPAVGEAPEVVAAMAAHALKGLAEKPV